MHLSDDHHLLKIQRLRFGCSLLWGPRELRERVGRGETAATSTSLASSLLQASFDEMVAIYCGALCKGRMIAQ